MTISEFIILHLVILNTSKINFLEQFSQYHLTRFQIAYPGSIQKDVRKSVETVKLEYYATLRLGVAQMDVWIIGYLHIVQVLTFNPIEVYILHCIEAWTIDFNVFFFIFVAHVSSSIANLGCPVPCILCFLFIQLMWKLLIRCAYNWSKF